MEGAEPVKGGSKAWMAVVGVIIAIIIIIAALWAAGVFAPAEEEAGPIKVGVILPVSGPLDWLGAPMVDAANLAEEEINAQGGVLGRTLELVHCDSQTTPAGGSACATTLILAEGVVAIVGAASSGVSQAVTTVTFENRIVQVSPASTSNLFTTIEVDYSDANAISPIWDKEVPGYFWRTAPSDDLQGQVLFILSEDNPGWVNVSIISVNNPYGKGLAGYFADLFTDGGGNIVGWVNYTEQQADYTSDLQLLANGNPDAVLFVGYPGDGLTVMQNWEAKKNDPGWGWDWFWSEGLKSETFLVNLKNANIDVSGIDGTAPVFTGANYGTFRDNYFTSFDREPEVFDAHTYDAVYLIAAAIERGGSADAETIRTNLEAVGGGSGTVVKPTEWAKIVTELEAGRQINYEGASGSIDFNQVGEPLSDYEIWKITGDLTAGFAYTRQSLITADQLTPPTIP